MSIEPSKSGNYYRILGVPPDANQASIKRAYRKLAKEFHPDRNRHDPFAEDLVKRLNEAYSVLSDPASRQHYDVGLARVSQSETRYAPQYKYNQDITERIAKRLREHLKPPEFSLKTLPQSHYLSLFILLFALIFFPLSRQPTIDGSTWLFLLIHALHSSYWVHRFLVGHEQPLPQMWFFVLLTHMFSLLGSVFLTVVVSLCLNLIF